MVLYLPDSQQDVASVAIGKGAVGFPEILRQRTLAILPSGKLALDLTVFS